MSNGTPTLVCAGGAGRIAAREGDGKLSTRGLNVGESGARAKQQQASPHGLDALRRGVTVGGAACVSRAVLAVHRCSAIPGALVPLWVGRARDSQYHASGQIPRLQCICGAPSACRWPLQRWRPTRHHSPLRMRNSRCSLPAPHALTPALTRPPPVPRRPSVRAAAGFPSPTPPAVRCAPRRSQLLAALALGECDTTRGSA